MVKLMKGPAAKAKAGAVASGIAGPGAAFAVLYAINEVIPDAPWWARAALFVIVAAAVGYGIVYASPKNKES